MKENKSTYIKLAIVLFVLFLIVQVAIVIAEKKELVVSRDVKAEVKENADLVIEDILEMRTEKFSDSDTHYITYDKANNDNITDVRVSYLKNGKWVPLTRNKSISSDGKEKPGFYHVGVFHGEFEIAWGIINKGDITKYKIEYISKESVKKYDDTAEFYHQFIGKRFKIPTKNFYAFIKFPKEINKDNAKIWGHGAETGEIFFKDGGVEIKAKNINENTMVEGRVLFGEELLPLAKSQNRTRKRTVLEEEKINTANTVSIANNIKREDQKRVVLRYALIVLTGVVVCVEGFKLYRKKQEREKLNIKKWDRFTGVPETGINISAASVIYENKNINTIIQAMIMKFVAKGYLKIEKIYGDDDKINVDSVESKLRQKIASEVFNESRVNIDPYRYLDEYAKALKKEVKKEVNDLDIPQKNVNNIIYVFDYGKIGDAKDNGLFEEEDDILLTFLTSGKVDNENFQSSIIKRLTNALQKETEIKDGNECRSMFEKIENGVREQLRKDDIKCFNEVEVFKGLKKGYETISNKFFRSIESKKVDLERQGIYLKSKERSIESSKGMMAIYIIATAVILYLLFKNNRPIIFYPEDWKICSKLAMIPIVAILVMSFLQYQFGEKPLTEKGYNIYEEYKGLYKFFTNDSYISEYNEESSIIWGEFLVLATFFGVAGKVLKTLKQVKPEIAENNDMLRSMYIANIYSNNIHSAYNAIRTAELAKTASSYGGSFGGGGGFTSGGGGGFGGGGGGSR